MSQKSGKHIKQLRKDLKLNQTEFATKIGVTQSYISQIESDNINVSLSLFLDWCKQLNLKEITLKIN
ncbi:helix-turn-helix domain-containing protein [Tenacibaculum ovolyticum]|uniref:helix-turn-helix domain-containing protein n=1 Tax=Tenacibaculum ovolyticum TaxID=104270 RepID=UPI0007EDE00F|nr:helix-turn-helix transcriptional regulator [Tenacibaculum ovolyticum]